MTAKVFIDGEAGTTGLQLRQRLSARRDIELLHLSDADRKDSARRGEMLNTADVSILCLPDAAAREAVLMVENPASRVIDASTAHRIAEGWAYGFAEMSRAQADVIAAARFVANPGCYPQGPIATLRPLIEAGLLPADFAVTVNAVSGYSGGGRQMIEAYEADAAAASHYAPYALGFSHKHLPEMRRYAELARDPLFQPAVINVRQGMATFVPLQLGTLDRVPTGAQLHAAIADYFAGISGGFVDVAPLEAIEKSAQLDPTRHNDTNRMTLHVFANDSRAQALLVAIYDNLGKGASGAAVQNLNLMLGVDAATSLAA